MAVDPDYVTWLIEDAGHAVIEKKAEHGFAALTPLEHLIYCVWVADYGMRNAGDLSTARDLYPSFQDEARRLAEKLSLPRTRTAFELPPAELETAYFGAFEGFCAELCDAEANLR